MRVCMVTSCFPRFISDGLCTFIWEAANALTQEGVEIRILALHTPSAKVHEQIAGVEVIRLPYWVPESKEILRKEGGGLPVTLRKYPLAWIQIWSFLIIQTLGIIRYTKDCDLIHTHWTLSALIALLGHGFHRKPILATVHGSDIYKVTRSSLGRALTRQILRRCDQVTAVSADLRSRTIASGVDAKMIQVISNGVDLNRFTPSETEREDYLLFVGSLIERKGCEYLLRAMQLVVRDFPHYRLLLAGEGPQEQGLRRLAIDLGIASNIKFLGFRPSNEISVIMRRAKLFVLPSLEEAQGVVLLEALASGTPIVASNVNGIPEVVVPEVGKLVPPRDPEALARAIVTCLRESDELYEMSVYARARAEKLYDWHCIAEQYLATYQKIIC